MLIKRLLMAGILSYLGAGWDIMIRVHYVLD